MELKSVEKSSLLNEMWKKDLNEKLKGQSHLTSEAVNFLNALELVYVDEWEKFKESYYVFKYQNSFYRFVTYQKNPTVSVDTKMSSDELSEYIRSGHSDGQQIGERVFEYFGLNINRFHGQEFDEIIQGNKFQTYMKVMRGE